MCVQDTHLWHQWLETAAYRHLQSLNQAADQIAENMYEKV